MRINFLVALGVGQAVLGFCSLQGLTGTWILPGVCPEIRALGREARVRELRWRGFQCLPF